jgi:hypothetical protein
MTDESAFDSRHNQESPHFCTASRPAVRPTQPHIQWVRRRCFSGVKRPGREADCLSLSSDEVKNAGAIPLLPVHLRSIMLI